MSERKGPVVASTQTTTHLTLDDSALPCAVPVEVTTDTLTQDEVTPAAGAVVVALSAIPAGGGVTAAQAARIADDLHEQLGWEVAAL